GPVAPCASYFSCQTSFPVAASRQRMISFSCCRLNTYSLSPTSAGVATPSPTVTFHFCVSSLGQVWGALKPVALPSRLGPRHWGQSWAQTQVAPNSSAQLAITRFVDFVVYIFTPMGWLPCRLPGLTLRIERNPRDGKMWCLAGRRLLLKNAEIENRTGGNRENRGMHSSVFSVASCSFLKDGLINRRSAAAS